MSGEAAARRGARQGRVQRDGVEPFTLGDMGELTAALQRELAGEVRDDAYTRHLFAADASLFAIEPQAVAFPRDADDVAAAMSVCARFGVPIVPRGGGTSLAGQAAGGPGLVLDCS